MKNIAFGPKSQIELDQFKRSLNHNRLLKHHSCSFPSGNPDSRWNCVLINHPYLTNSLLICLFRIRDITSLTETFLSIVMSSLHL
jgi:hypothetical protein